ncbi:MAG: hypothetical protein IJT27_03760 [Clostridia bacterium]|nr:hypothetical protein [Clostridia bacterium]
MKKGRAFFCILISLLLVALSLTACGKKSENADNGPADAVADTPEEAGVTVGGETFELTYESNHKCLYYKEDLRQFQRDTMGSFREIRYFKDDTLLFSIHLVYYEGKTVEEVMEGSDNTLTEKTVNGLTYRYFEYDENGLPGHTYVYAYDGTAYTISFVSGTDISALENAFMENVRFAEES